MSLRKQVAMHRGIQISRKEGKATRHRPTMDQLASNRPKRHFLPIEQRLRLFNEVLQLRRQGLSYSHIIKRIHRSREAQLNGATVSRWVNGKSHPLGHVNVFHNQASPELAYIIGTLLSDGDRRQYGGHHALRLRVKDYEYAFEFGRCLTKVLGRREPYVPRWNEKEQNWLTEASSILLFRHLAKPWHQLRDYIEASKACVAACLRAFYDGEGSVEGRRLTVYNSHKELLLYVKHLLRRYFHIEATGPHKTGKVGYLFRDPRNEKTYETKKQCYYLYVPATYRPKFQKHVGFTISRKQLKLIEAIQK